MAYQTNQKAPEIIFRDGRPAAVILDIEDYRDMLERLEDLEDLRRLKDMEQGSLNFKKIDDFLEEHHPERAEW